MKLITGLAAAASALALCLAAPAGAARLDRSFGERGFVEAPDSAEWVGLAPAPGHRAANYPGGRLVVGGHSSAGFAVHRFLADGRPDRGFGEEGVAVVRLPGEGREGTEEGPFGSVSAVAVQPDGRILVAGLYTPNPPWECEECSPEYSDPREHSAIVRLNPDGSLDTRFGGSRRGRRHEGILQLYAKSVNALALRGGRIYLAGEDVDPAEESGETGYVARLRLNGRVDRSFGSRGAVYLPRRLPLKGYESSSVGAIRFAPGGRIYAAGYDDGRFMLAGLRRSGDLDRRFGRSGFVRTDLGGACRCALGQGLARDSKGRLVVSGYAARRGGDSYRFAVARFRPGGRPDRSFGRAGVVRTRVGSRNAYGDGVVVQPDGRIVVAGAAEESLAVVRYLSDGRLDRRFFGDGIFRSRFVKGGDRGVQPFLDPSGRLLVAGETVVARFR